MLAAGGGGIFFIIFNGNSSIFSHRIIFRFLCLLPALSRFYFYLCNNHNRMSLWIAEKTNAELVLLVLSNL